MAVRCFYGFSVFLALCGLVAIAVSHIVGFYDKGRDLGIYRRRLDDIWESYDIDMVQTNWFQYIWVAVYAYQAFWLLYSLSAPCRKTKTGFLGAHPPVMPPSIYICFILSLGCLAGYITLWGIYHDEYAVYSIILIMGAAIFSCIALCISLYATKRHGEQMEDEGHGGTMWSIRIFMQNGLGAFCAWTLINIFYIMNVLLVKSKLATRETSGFATLGILMGYLLIWLFLDVIVTREPMAFLFTPYIITIVAFAMSVDKNTGNPGMQFYISILFLVLAGILTLVKISLTAGRFSRQKREDDKDSFGAVSYEENHGSESSINEDDDLGNLDHLSDQLYVIS